MAAARPNLVKFRGKCGRRIQPLVRRPASYFPIEGEKTMSDRKHKGIVGAQRMNENEILVEYSDDSSAVYSAFQLSSLVPIELMTESEIEEEDDEPHIKNVLQFPPEMSGTEPTAS
jgi:hypothetical protein